jgi:hypothetical protein
MRDSGSDIVIEFAQATRQHYFYHFLCWGFSENNQGNGRYNRFYAQKMAA